MGQMPETDTSDRSASDTEAASAEASLDDARVVAEEKIAVLQDEKLRLLAEFQNYRRRAERDRFLARQDGVADLVRRILPCLSDLSRAIEAARSDKSHEALVGGLLLVQKGFSDALTSFGVSEIDPTGLPFDAEHMEGVGQMPSNDIPAGSVALVVQKGYRFDDRLIRPAQVLLSSGPAPGGSPDTTAESAP